MSTTTGSSEKASDAPTESQASRSGLSKYRLVAIYVSLSIALFLPPLELTSVSTALPTIVHDLDGTDFIWVTASYTLASTAVLPMSANLANIFGRRPAMLASLVLFIIGSAVCGSAQNIASLIAGRAIQGMGGGSIISYTNIILSDIIPLRRRGMIGGILNIAWSLGAGFGPLVGGALSSHGQWRWLFYLNIPVCGLAFVTVFLFVPTFETPEGNLVDKLLRLDWPGIFLVISSSSAIIIALTWSGTVYSWSSVQVLAPLIIGFAGLALFMYYEKVHARQPIMPWRIFSNLTTLSGYIQTFLNHLVNLAVINYLTVYLQACKSATAQQSGIDTLAFSFVLGPMVFLTGVSVSRLNFYRPQAYIGWGFNILSLALLSTLTSESALSLTIGYSALLSIGGGIVSAMTQFPVLAPLAVSDAAHGWAFLVFCRSFAAVWGVSIGGTILQNELSARLPSEFQLERGADIAFSAIPLISALDDPLKSEVTEAFASAVSVIWKVLAGIAGLGIMSALLMKAVPLHETAGKSADSHAAGAERTTDDAQDHKPA